MLVKLIVGAFLIGHAAIHASFVSPRPKATVGAPQWPFEMGRSWLLTPAGFGRAALRPIGVALVVLNLVAFGTAALVAVGIAPLAVWVPAVVVGATASLALLTMFFHPWLVLGLVIDVALIWAVVVAGWTPAG